MHKVFHGEGGQFFFHAGGRAILSKEQRAVSDAVKERVNAGPAQIDAPDSAGDRRSRSPCRTACRAPVRLACTCSSRRAPHGRRSLLTLTGSPGRGFAALALALVVYGVTVAGAIASGVWRR